MERTNSKLLYQRRIAAGKKVKEKSYWLKKLAGEPVKSSFPTLYKREAQEKTAKQSLSRVNFKFSEELSAKLLKLSADSDVRLHIILAAGLTLLIHKYTGSEDIIIGTPIYKFKTNMKLINTVLPLRNRLEEWLTFKQLLMQVKQSVAEANENRNYPIEVLIEQLNMTVVDGDFPLFDVAILVENIHDKEYLGHVNPNIIFSFLRNDGAIAGYVEYNPLLYNEKGVEGIICHFKNLLRNALTNADVNAVDIEILAVEEKKQLLKDINDTSESYPGDKTLHELFEEQLDRTPDSVAVVGSWQGVAPPANKGAVGKRERAGKSVQLTYRELNEKSNHLAHLLRDKGIGPDIIVGLMVDRSIGMIVGILGILKAGGAYLPIEAGLPEERIRYMLKDCRAKVLVAAPTNQVKVEVKVKEDSIEQIEIINIYKELSCSTSTLTSTCQVSSANLAYVIYTSGTTGKPKGVLTTHYNVTRVVRNTNYIEITPQDRILQLSNYAFDGSVFDIYGALLNSAALVMINKEEASTVDRLSAVIKREAITVFFVTTALFNTLVDLDLECFDGVRRVLFGGERVSVEHSRKALEYLGKNRIIHVYGPTETTVYAACYFIDSIDETAGTIPIGKPISNTTAYILDNYLNPVPIGVSGELYIGGTGTARGYLNSPELTAEKFILAHSSWLIADRREKKVSSSGELPMSYELSAMSYLYKTGDLVRWLTDGNIEFIGRIDHQVKIRGFRIELGEIESHLLAHDEIKEVVVLSKEDNRGTPRYLCAYLVSERELSTTGLREYLSESLPEYMIPAFFIRMEKIPLTSNGKVDHKSLPEPETGRKPGTVYVPPRSEIEKKLVEIWSEMLGVHFSISIDDNFFELGGQSLMAMRMAPRLKEVFHVNVPLNAFFQQGTIRRIAQLIEQLQVEEQPHEVSQFEMDHSLSGLKLEKTKRVNEDL